MENSIYRANHSNFSYVLLILVSKILVCFDFLNLVKVFRNEIMCQGWVLRKCSSSKLCQSTIILPLDHIESKAPGEEKEQLCKGGAKWGPEPRTVCFPFLQAVRKATLSPSNHSNISSQEEQSLDPVLWAPPGSGSLASPGFPVCGKETGWADKSSEAYLQVCEDFSLVNLQQPWPKWVCFVCF